MNKFNLGALSVCAGILVSGFQNCGGLNPSAVSENPSLSTEGTFESSADALGQTMAVRSDATSQLVVEASGKCVDVAFGSKENGAVIHQWDCDPGRNNDNQEWRLIPKGQSVFQIMSVSSGKCLDVAHRSQDDGAPIVQWECHGRPHQLFRLEPVSFKNYRLVAVHSGKCLDAPTTNTGQQFTQYSCHGGANQMFRPNNSGEGSGGPPSAIRCSRQSGISLYPKDRMNRPVNLSEHWVRQSNNIDPALRVLMSEDDCFRRCESFGVPGACTYSKERINTSKLSGNFYDKTTCVFMKKAFPGDPTEFTSYTPWAPQPPSSASYSAGLCD